MRCTSTPGDRTQVENRLDDLINLFQHGGVIGQTGCPALIRVRIEEAVFLTKPKKYLSGILGRVSQPLQDGRHLALNPSDLFQADFMNLFWGQIGGGVTAQAVGIIGISIRQCPNTVDCRWRLAPGR